MNCCFWMMNNNNNNNKKIDISNTRYYGKVDTIFTLRNDFFMCPPFHSYNIIDNYDKKNIVINEIKYFFGDETHDGAGYQQYHDISFLTSGKYEIRIQDLQNDKIQTYIFIIKN